MTQNQEDKTTQKSALVAVAMTLYLRNVIILINSYLFHYFQLFKHSDLKIAQIDYRLSTLDSRGTTGHRIPHSPSLSPQQFGQCGNERIGFQSLVFQL